MVKINLLPWRDQLREEKKREFFSLSVLVIAMVAFVFLMVHLTLSGKISRQESRNKLLMIEIKSMDEQIAEIQELEKERDSLIARMQIIQELQMNRPLTVKLFDNLVQAVTSGIFLEKTSRQEDKIMIQGFAESNSEVSALMRNIMISKWISNPKLREVKKRDANDKSSKEEKTINPNDRHSKAFELEFSIRKIGMTDEEQDAEEALKNMKAKAKPGDKNKKPGKPDKSKPAKPK